ncbi:hypothetical protein BMF94_0366 [Rhodotorula taiwanensis]|uniref:Cytokinin riboside 5'-monophosphate phosphoribohydrolase n=1 Tax=Rhodotorula taiwanensis TaxID=741276 RepID=A0A2S5BIE1_9BASI|nr:hypothetical protein BMF94_0366 [Rhodotorula taiwanensis]
MVSSPSNTASPATGPAQTAATNSNEPKAITVFCGSSPGNDPVYLEAAEQLAARLAHSGIELIYGGGTKGLMGKIATAALDAGGKVHGIIPSASKTAQVALTVDSSLQFLSAEAPDRGANSREHETETVVGSMHERKKLMADLSDAFIGLPGGYGTLEEVAEMTTWSQIGVHLKPVILLNVNNFYSSLRDFIQNAVSAGFIGAKQSNLLIFVDGPTASASASGGDSSSFDWGLAALAAIRDWHAKGAGGAEPYSFEWSDDRKKAEGVL